MAAAAPSGRRRPLPGPGPLAHQKPDPGPTSDPGASQVHRPPTYRPPAPRRAPAPQPAAPTQVVAAAGTAIVTAARVGRILGRSGWRIARQLPGAQALEREAQRLQRAAVTEVRKRLDLSHDEFGTASDEERRAVLLVRDSGSDEAPLRSAMSELLERSVETDRRASRDYLFGTIISQLVPDEARILAALSHGRAAGTIDVVIRLARGRTRAELAHSSTIGRAAGLSSPESTPTYLSRLVGFGLLQTGPEDEALGTDYEILATDNGVRSARARAEARRQGSVRLVRGTVSLSPLGREFWAATDPSQSAQPHQSPQRALPS